MTDDISNSIWHGVYTSFAEAAGDTSVFDGEVWLSSVERRCTQDLAALRQPGPISPLAATQDYALPVLTAIVHGAQSHAAVLDFGGGLASACLGTIASLPAEADVQFTVVETEAVCEAGIRNLAVLPQIRFTRALPDPNTPFDVIHAGSSLHYVEDWRDMIGRLAQYSARYMLFSDVPAGDVPSFVTTQFYYGRRIPVHFWNVNEFVATLEAHGYRLIYRALFKARVRGVERELPTEALPPTHRLRHSCHLMFLKD